MCRSVIGRYRFGWIAVVERRIKRDPSGPDRIVPLRLSDSFGGVRSRSNGSQRGGGRAHSEARFPARFAGEACRWRAPAAFRRVLSDGEATTGHNSTGGARELDRLLRFLPDVSGRGGWRQGGRR
jgi:hypothetical protein